MIGFLFFISLALPTYLIRFSIFDIPTTVLEILIYLAFLIQGGRFLRSKKLPKLPLGKIWWFISLFLLAAVIGVIISTERRVALGILKGWIIDPVLLFSLIVWNLKSKEDWQKIIWGLLLGATIVGFWAILQAFGLSYLLPHQRTDPSFLSYLQNGRVFGPFESPNYLGMYLVPISLLGLGQWFIIHWKNHKPGYFLSFCLLVILLALFFSQSLGAWLSFAFALLFFLGFVLFSKKRVIFWTFSFLILIVITAVAFQWGPERLRDSLSNRLEVWEVSWFLVKQHPILGIGLGAFPKLYNQVIPQIHFPPLNWIQFHPHNVILAFWLNTGLLGLASFLGIIVIFFQNLQKMPRFLLIEAWILRAAMITILVHGLIDTTYWKNDLSALFWILIAAAVILPHQAGENGHHI